MVRKATFSPSVKTLKSWLFCAKETTTVHSLLIGTITVYQTTNYTLMQQMPSELILMSKEKKSLTSLFLLLGYTANNRKIICYIVSIKTKQPQFFKKLQLHFRKRKKIQKVNKNLHNCFFFFWFFILTAVFFPLFFSNNFTASVFLICISITNKQNNFAFFS